MSRWKGQYGTMPQGPTPELVSIPQLCGLAGTPLTRVFPALPRGTEEMPLTPSRPIQYAGSVTPRVCFQTPKCKHVLSIYEVPSI